MVGFRANTGRNSAHRDKFHSGRTTRRTRSRGLFEVIAAVEVAILVEAIVDGGMGGSEILPGLYVADFAIAAQYDRRGSSAAPALLTFSLRI